MKSREQVAAASEGLSTSTQVSKPSPVEPSARYQVSAGSRVPMDSEAQVRSAPYMERSTTMSPPVDLTTVERS